MISLDNALLLAGIGFELLVVALLLYRQAWRTLPVFFTYSLWSPASSAGAYAVLHLAPRAYLSSYLAQQAVDSALQFGVLVELAWAVLRPLRDSLPKRTPLLIAGIVLVIGLLIWPFAVVPGIEQLPASWRALLKLEQSVSILRVLLFLVLAGCSQLLSIGWKNRELQIATGLGFYSLASLAVAIVHLHQHTGPLYNTLDQFLVATYIGSLLYWVVCFAQREAERREFTPQMESFLLAVAGAARNTRVALANSSEGKPGGQDNG